MLFTPIEVTVAPDVTVTVISVDEVVSFITKAPSPIMPAAFNRI
jgi:hypothetical protein